MTASEAASTTSSKPPVADRVGTVVLLVVHALMAGGTAFVLMFAPMVTDPCAATECGSENWVKLAMGLGVWGSVALVLADVALSIVRMNRRKAAWAVPLLFCVAQVALFCAGYAIASLGGPVNS